MSRPHDPHAHDGHGHAGQAHGDHDHDHDDHVEAAHGTMRDYVTGFVLSVILTAIPFWLVMNGVIASAGMTAAVILARRAGAARRDKYQVKRNVASSLSSRTMRWGGATLLIFIIWHLINFTAGKVNPQTGETGDAAGDPYSLLVDTFSVWWMTIIYLVAMLALAFHLHHGTWSSIQTLGYTNTASSRARAKQAGWLLAIVIAGGYSLVPLAVLTGIIEK